MGGSRGIFEAARQAALEAEKAANAQGPTDSNRFQPSGTGGQAPGQGSSGGKKGSQPQQTPEQQWDAHRPQFQARRQPPSHMFGVNRFSGQSRNAPMAFRGQQLPQMGNRGFAPPPPAQVPGAFRRPPMSHPQAQDQGGGKKGGGNTSTPPTQTPATPPPSSDDIPAGQHRVAGSDYTARLAKKYGVTGSKGGGW